MLENLYNKLINWYLPILAFIFIIAIWQILSIMNLFEPWLLPSPSAIFLEFLNSTSFLLYHMSVTGYEIILGVALAVILGIILGFSMTLSKVLERSILPYVIASQVIPIFALAPILIVWFGAGLLSKIIVVFLISFFPICIGVFAGLNKKNNEMENMLKTMGASTYQIYSLLKIKLALPSFFSGLKVAAVSSVIGAVVAEWIGSKAGLGWIMKVSGPLFQTERVFASIFLLSLFASVLFLSVKIIEKKLIKGVY